ncbi:MAG: 4Fe-4S binding protein [Verrucomicrobia bacterium]|nr:4Fe-4S binding protein [Verrucomicrobiota bacterium]
MSSGLSRRGLFSLLGRSLRGPAEATKAAVSTAISKPGSPEPATEPQEKVAVIQGRFCLAYTSFCTVCSERCPVPGAMKVDRGIPMVVTDLCTGCGVCHDACPSPTNAVLVIPRRRSPRFTPPSPSAT